MWLLKEGAILPKSKRKRQGKRSEMETTGKRDFSDGFSEAQGV